MIPLHYMRRWLSTPTNYTRRHSHGRGAGTAHFASAAGATHLALAGSARCAAVCSLPQCNECVGLQPSGLRGSTRCRGSFCPVHDKQPDALQPSLACCQS